MPGTQEAGVSAGWVDPGLGRGRGVQRWLHPSSQHPRAGRSHGGAAPGDFFKSPMQVRPFPSPLRLAACSPRSCSPPARAAAERGVLGVLCMCLPDQALGDLGTCICRDKLSGAQEISELQSEGPAKFQSCQDQTAAEQGFSGLQSWMKSCKLRLRPHGNT